MRKLELIAPCHFGLEAVLKREIIDLGYEISSVEDGRVSFYGDEDAICRANIFLRTAERVLLKVGSFTAVTFEELFDKTKALPWEEYIPKNGKFWVAKAASVKSRLFSPSDIQSIMKKAMVRRLQERYHVEWFPEDGPSYPVRVFLMKDIVTVGIDTSGISLHKRGYREVSGKAPITETLAAALVKLSRPREEVLLRDPFCGSGTIAVEGAMMMKNIAPGLNRTFCSEDFPQFPAELWSRAREAARDAVITDSAFRAAASDIDGECIEIAKAAARRAGVADSIDFFVADALKLETGGVRGTVVTNPPYGERLMRGEAEELYRNMGRSWQNLDRWQIYVLTSHPDFQRLYGRRADKVRKLYNGMIPCNYYQFFKNK